MTDEQIEKGLEHCRIHCGEGGCENCPYDYVSPIDFSCIDSLANDSLDYIKRLKDESERLCAALKLAQARADDAEQALQNARKETAEEILTSLRKDISQCYGDYVLDVVDGYIESYGVEVVELPCKVGDDVFYIFVSGPYSKIIHSKVATLTMHDRVIVASLNDSCRYLTFDYGGHIVENNEVYFTKEAAEARLKELQG